MIASIQLGIESLNVFYQIDGCCFGDATIIDQFVDGDILTFLNKLFKKTFSSRGYLNTGKVVCFLEVFFEMIQFEVLRVSFLIPNII